MIDYMECRIAAAVSSVEDCGCDVKLQATANDDEPAVPFHQHHLKNYTEEFFNHTVKEDVVIFISSHTAYNNIIAPQQLSGYLHKLLQPPRC